MSQHPALDILSLPATLNSLIVNANEYQVRDFLYLAKILSKCKVVIIPGLFWGKHVS